MNACDWCESITNELFDINGFKLCKKCKDMNNSSRCWKCGNEYPKELMIRGKCLECAQVDEAIKSKNRLEAQLGVCNNDIENISGQIDMTEEEYESWLSMKSKNFSTNDLKENVYLRKIWIIVKLNAVGITDQETINENMEDIEYLIDTKFNELINNKCKIVILRTSADRALINNRCIGHKNKVYIIEV